MKPSNHVIPCELLEETRERIAAYVQALKESAPRIGDHDLSEREFWESGLFRSAIETLRGTQAASTQEKRAFMASILDHLKQNGEVSDWAFAGTGERHDYEVNLKNGRIAVIETKGCLDGNNTNIFERPPQADEFIIWSLCQNPGADPRKNAWSGIHTRLGAEIMHRRQLVDGLIIWDMLCGTAGRPCPKLVKNSKRVTVLSNGKKVPPPCLYTFPRSVPDPRNNPYPKCWKLKDVSLLAALSKVFHGDDADLTEVHIEARMQSNDVQRRTSLVRLGKEIVSSDWTSISRARR